MARGTDRCNSPTATVLAAYQTHIYAHRLPQGHPHSTQSHAQHFTAT